MDHTNLYQNTHDMNEHSLRRRKFLKLGGLATAATVISPVAYSLSTQTNNAPYEFDPRPHKIRLFSNENPYGPPKEVQQVISNQLSRINRYASYHTYDTVHLSEAIAAKNGLNSNQVILGHGSFDILRMLARAFGKTQNSLITPALTFNVVGRFADKIFDHKQIQIPLTSRMDIDLNATAQAVTIDTRLIFICNPNNPTGKVLNPSDLENFCKKLASKNCVVVVDEAYIDMIEPKKRPNTVSLLSQKYNVLIIRTFSKAYGMAGLRIGYAMGLPDTIEHIKSEHYTFTGLLNNLGVAAAITALKDDNHLAAFRKKNNEVKKYVENNLQDFGIEFIPSETNFILLNVKDLNRYRGALETVGISPVGGSGKTYPNWSRISIGTLEDMKYYIKALSTMDWLIKK